MHPLQLPLLPRRQLRLTTFQLALGPRDSHPFACAHPNQVHFELGERGEDVEETTSPSGHRGRRSDHQVIATHHAWQACHRCLAHQGPIERVGRASVPPACRRSEPQPELDRGQDALVSCRSCRGRCRCDQAQRRARRALGAGAVRSPLVSRDDLAYPSMSHPLTDRCRIAHGDACSAYEWARTSSND